MAGIKEIRTKIKSVQNTRKITKAMEMVAASKMRKAQDRMRASRPYTDKIRTMVSHLTETNPDYDHPYLAKKDKEESVGIILITTDKGLCGGLNSNIMRLVLQKVKSFQDSGVRLSSSAIGNKGLGFLQRIGVPVHSQLVHLADKPVLEELIGILKVQFDAYLEGKVDAIYLAYSRFVNTMKQEPVFEKILPLPENYFEGKNQYHWDFIYEPDIETVIDELLKRYIEALVYQAVAENMASEQSARMVAMKAASDNAKKVINELQLVYNKTRQAAITKEISEIVGGAAAV